MKGGKPPLLFREKMKALRVSPQVDPEVDSAKQENKLLVAGLLTIKKAGGGGISTVTTKQETVNHWLRKAAEESDKSEQMS